ncbi:MAG: hypothetical protein IRZ16_23365 [Myxococcaceae bacterium]|nr:hypothetical protein [Myxococcaceae bacterium]
METFIIFLMALPSLADRAGDPSLNAFRSKAEARNMECTRVSQAQAHERFPGQVPEPSPRVSSNLMDIDALVCTPRIVRVGERPARDEAILSSLSQSVSDIAQVAGAVGDPDTLWHVDAFYPDPRVAHKIAVAARTHLVETGHLVSDRVPLLAAGDLLVMRDLPERKRFELACARFFAEHALGEHEAFLGITVVDPRETQLHAGVCQKGVWQWLR